jgi:transposase
VRPYGSGLELEKRRMSAMTMLKNGFFPVEVARKLGVDRRSVRRWKATYKKEGIKALKSRPALGRPRRIGEKLKFRIEKMLLKGPRAAGMAGFHWTYRLVAGALRKHYGISYHPNYIGPLLRSMGWDWWKLKRAGKTPLGRQR